MTRKAKGIGSAGCCCGGCAQKPMDEREGRREDNRILQSYCCRCIPNTICVSVSEYGYEDQNVVVHRGCDNTVYDGHAIQYTASVSISGTSRTMCIRMFVQDEQCHIGWDIPDLELEDFVLIDDTIPSVICNLNMEPKQCSEFGGEWTSGDITITIAEAPSQSVKDLIECGGCGCVCDCMCISIWSRTSTSIWSIEQSNATVCSTLGEAYEEGCGITEFKKVPNVLSWELDGWNLTLTGRREWMIAASTVVVGTETISGTCTVRHATSKADEFSHTIDGVGAQVIYEWNLEHRVADGYKWLGNSHDETSVLTIELYDWVAAAWVVKVILNGRADAETIELMSVRPLTSEYTGTGVDLGKVKMRITTTGDQLVTDMVQVTVSECCAMTLTPPYGVTPTTTLPLYEISEECPSPSPYWLFFDAAGTEWRFSAECRWCGGTCGSRIVSCCPRPLPRFLFAEVQISCPGCVGVPFTVPLDAGPTGSIWSGCTNLCNVDADAFCLNISCSSGTWKAQVTLAPGACTLDGVLVSATSVSCDPLSIVFSGTLKFGINCCGPAGGFGAMPGITITVIE